jgi:hypothetical protein
LLPGPEAPPLLWLPILSEAWPLSGRGAEACRFALGNVFYLSFSFLPFFLKLRKQKHKLPIRLNSTTWWRSMFSNRRGYL